MDIREGIAQRISAYLTDTVIQDLANNSERIRHHHGVMLGEILTTYLKSEGLVRKVACCAWSQVKEGESWWAMPPCHYCNSTGYKVEEL